MSRWTAVEFSGAGTLACACVESEAGAPRQSARIRIAVSPVDGVRLTYLLNPHSAHYASLAGLQNSTKEENHEKDADSLDSRGNRIAGAVRNNRYGRWTRPFTVLAG